MLLYAKIVDDIKKICEVGTGTNTAFYQSIGMSEMYVEQGYDNNWYLQGYAPQKDLQISKRGKWKEIKSSRDKAKQSGFEYMGKTFDSDAASVTCINSACIKAQVAIANNIELQIEWTTKDNSIILLNAQQMLDCAVALAEHFNRCHVYSQELRVLIESSTTQDELEKILWLKS